MYNLWKDTLECFKKSALQIHRIPTFFYILAGKSYSIIIITFIPNSHEADQISAAYDITQTPAYT